MKISEARKQALYDAIYNPIMAKRVACQKAGRKDGLVSADGTDHQLFLLEQEIFKEVCRVLGIDDDG